MQQLWPIGLNSMSRVHVQQGDQWAEIRTRICVVKYDVRTDEKKMKTHFLDAS